MLVSIIITFPLFVFSVVPIWNIKDFAINLLKNQNSYTYIITNRLMYELYAKLEKVINKTIDGKITHENFLYIKKREIGNIGNIINYDPKGKVFFENIDSFYGNDLYADRMILCPIGKFQVINLDNMEEIMNEDPELVNDNNWVLKCYSHFGYNDNYNWRIFFVFYLSSGINQVYGLQYNNYLRFGYLQPYEEMYDFKLANRDHPSSNGNYPMCSLVKYQGFIQFIGTEYILQNDFNPQKSIDKNKTLIIAKEYSQAVFDNYTNDFYYFTYNNASDFCSGFSNKTVSGTDYYTNDVDVINNYISPFNFIDQAEIKEMKFLYYSKYVYYSIYNNKTSKTYHGVLDITLNKIIFNTDEDIDVFIPYSSSSMLAITKETAYRICFIKHENGSCIDECPNSENIIFDIDGNKCGTECDYGKYLIIPEDVCSSECNNYQYIAVGNKCGLCRDLNSTHKYKLINGTECLNEIIDGSEIYNEELYLLVCKQGYIFDGSICIADYQEQKCNNIYEFKNEFLSNIEAYINSPHLFDGSNCEAKVLKTNDIGVNDSVKINISEIFLGLCPQILKEHYQISQEESLILLIMESTKNGNNYDTNSFHLGIDILLNIFYISGRQLDLSFCQSYIRINHNISQFKELDIKTAKNLAKQGIDVFNASDGFFNDLCHPYDDEDGNDIILYDRRKEIYQNVTFCQPGCVYSNVDYNLTSVVCLCDSNYLQGNFNNSNKKNKNMDQSELFNFKELASTFKTNLLISNINAIYCYNLVFDKNIIKINIGFYCLIILFLSQFIFFVFSYIKN